MTLGIERKNPKSVAPPVASYSHLSIVPKHAQLFVLSGQLGMDRDGGIPPDINLQVRNALDNCKRILASEGLDETHLIKVNVWLTESIDRSEYSKYWHEFHQGNPPAATLVYVQRLSQPQYKVEVEVWAAR